MVAVTAAACSGDENRADDDGSDETSTSSSETTETSSVARNAEEQEVIDAYLAAEDAMIEAASRPDPEYPLAETHADPMLRQRQIVLEGLATDGLVFSFSEDSQYEERVTSVRVDEDVAYLQACVIDDGSRVRQETGEVVVGGGVSTVLVSAAMRRLDDVWKLAERREDDRRDGEASCPDDD